MFPLPHFDKPDVVRSLGVDTAHDTLLCVEREDWDRSDRYARRRLKSNRLRNKTNKKQIQSFQRKQTQKHKNTNVTSTFHPRTCMYIWYKFDHDLSALSTMMKPKQNKKRKTKPELEPEPESKIKQNQTKPKRQKTESNERTSRVSNQRRKSPCSLACPPWAPDPLCAASSLPGAYPTARTSSCPCFVVFSSAGRVGSFCGFRVGEAFFCTARTRDQMRYTRVRTAV